MWVCAVCHSVADKTPEWERVKLTCNAHCGAAVEFIKKCEELMEGRPQEPVDKWTTRILVAAHKVLNYLP